VSVTGAAPAAPGEGTVPAVPAEDIAPALLAGGTALAMEGVQDRSSLALERVVRRFEHRVRVIGHRYSLSPAELDELFQEVRIRLWKALEDPDRIEATPASYVYRTATSAAVDLLRRKRRNREQVPLDPEVHGTPRPTPPGDYSPEEAAEELALALEGLDDRRRPVVRMHLAGYHSTEIAALLGWTQGATRNLLYRGLADLKRDLLHRLERTP
jgi:RNA polymerase sigma factor (sigma-70 family)